MDEGGGSAALALFLVRLPGPRATQGVTRPPGAVQTALQRGGSPTVGPPADTLFPWAVAAPMEGGCVSRLGKSS